MQASVGQLHPVPYPPAVPHVAIDLAANIQPSPTYQLGMPFLRLIVTTEYNTICPCHLAAY